MKKLSLNEMAAVNGGGFADCAWSIVGYVGSVLVGVGGTVASGAFAPIVGAGSVLLVAYAGRQVTTNCPMNN
ncbi:hypothetical protein [Thermoflexibacter ruber]|uniref:Uncharacterized protein n=1 Tax=Thermoflexibacter ruber TaxID=1003 RepID=A0A1I2JVQ0_9BACT|nr:hypothetical protein [Thermoflexibacter ruber]SFF56871.1 hypothetical protein SAMN04488541_106017 [Thermoflexibacter ruber]